MSRDFKSLAYHLCRRGWHEQLISLCDSILAKKPKDVFANFWRAYGVGMSGNISNAIALFEDFQSKRDMQYPSTLALAYLHKKLPQGDEELVEQLLSEASVSEDVTKEGGLIIGARVALFTADYDTAERLAQRVLQPCKSSNTNPSTPIELEAMSVLHWIIVMNSISTGVAEKRSMQPIEAFVKSSPVESVDIDELMALAKAKTLLKAFPEALNIYNQIIAMHSWFIPALAEKAVILASNGEWEQCLDTTQRVLDTNGDNLDALKILAFHAFTQEALPDDAMQKFEDLEAVINQLESSSAPICAGTGSLFSRICCRHPRALQLCERLLDRAARLDPSNSLILCELGNVMNMQGEYKTAMRHYREASKRDGSNSAAIEGMVLSQILDGEVSDAESQIELLHVLQSSPDDTSAKLLFLEALLARVGSNRDTALHEDKLLECRKLFLAASSSDDHARFSLEPLQEFVLVDPDFTMVLAEEFLVHMETPVPLLFTLSSRDTTRGKFLSETSKSLGSNTSAVLPVGADSNIGGVTRVGVSPDVPVAVQLGIDLFQKLLKRFPGMIPIYISLSRCFSAQSKYEDACKCLRSCLSLQPHCSTALIALAKTESSRFNTVAASHALEQALSSDFSIRSSLLFKLVQATVRAQQGKADEALIDIDSIMKTDEFKSNINDVIEIYNRVTIQSGATKLTANDKVAVYIAQASLYNLARRVKDATKTLSEAKIVFGGTPQEVQILIASSHLAVERGDYDAAIRVLDKINEDSKIYTKAQLIKAEIMLINNRDKEGFTACYIQLVERNKSSSASYCMLGEAYLRILNPEAAVDAFEQAYLLDPSNAQLRERIGKSLVATHEYHRAVDFYESALRSVGKQSVESSSKSSEAVALGHDLAKLYTKLGRLDSAMRVLNLTLYDEHKDIYEMRNDIKTLRLLFEVQSTAAPAEVGETLKKSKELQKKLMNEVRLSLNSASHWLSDTMDKEKEELSSICVRYGNYLLSTENDVKGAESQFTEAIHHYPQSVTGMMGLAKLFNARHDNEQCISYCRKIILFDPSHEEAGILLSACLIQESTSEQQDEAAAKPLKDLLHGHPNNYHALSTLIILLRKIGQLELAKLYIAKAETNRRSGGHSGLHYCKGLYSRFTNDVIKAIMEFNLARKDTVWGESALVNMIELYLNPDQDSIWDDRDTENKFDETTAGHIRIAEELLKELKPISKDTIKYNSLINYCGYARKDKASIAAGIASFGEMLETDNENISALLGIATGYMLEKSQSKAIAILKKIGGFQRVAFEEDFEKSILLLARFQIDKSSNETVEELCNKCLHHNKSCAQAWSILALLKEKEAEYEVACEHYTKAWKLEFEAAATTGFKLAFCLLKSGKCVDAINICEKVLDQYPDYPRISEEILRKAQYELRTFD